MANYGKAIKALVETIKAEIETILNSETEKEGQYSKLLYYYTKNIEPQNIISFDDYLKVCKKKGTKTKIFKIQLCNQTLNKFENIYMDYYLLIFNLSSLLILFYY